MNLRMQQGRKTRQLVIDIATRLFSAEGFERTSIESVLREAGLSRGALYHHFASKEALFGAVLEQMEERIAEAVRSEAEGDGAASFLQRGCRAWLRLVLDPGISQIVLIDAPTVLGWVKWREVEARHGFGLLKAALRAAAPKLRDELVEIYAHLLLASLIELGLLVARARDGKRALGLAQDAIETLVTRLLATEQRGVG